MDNLRIMDIEDLMLLEEELVDTLQWHEYRDRTSPEELRQIEDIAAELVAMRRELSRRQQK